MLIEEKNMDMVLTLTKLVCSGLVKAAWMMCGIGALVYAGTGRIPPLDVKFYALCYVFGLMKALDED